MNNAVMAKDSYSTTVLAGIYRITGEKETVKKEKQKVPDVSNAVALIISSATRNFPVLEKVSENKFMAFQEECQRIILKTMNDYRSFSNK